MTMQPASSELEAVGTALAALREKRGYSQNQLARLSGVAQGTISRIEQGQSFEFGNLLILLSHLNKKAGDFMVDAGLTDESTGYQEVKVQIAFKVRGRLREISGTVVK